jgi:L-serine dehydratase
MKSIRQLYKAGIGPSSSHSMGPKNAALRFKDSLPRDVSRIQAELYGSLAATGKGHLTDKALEAVFQGWTFEIVWRPDVFLPHHPCGLWLKALDQNGKILAEQLFYSIGGGDLADQDGKPLDVAYPDYPVSGIEDVLAWCRAEHHPIWQFADQHEGAELWDYLRAVWKTMCEAIGRGLMPEDPILPGGLNLARRAPAMMACANERVGIQRDLNLLAAYALAVSEENAAGHTVVTAPTCGSCGIVPAVLYYFEKHIVSRPASSCRHWQPQAYSARRWPNAPPSAGPKSVVRVKWVPPARWPRQQRRSCSTARPSRSNTLRKWPWNTCSA